MHRIAAMLLMAVLGISGAGAGVFADAAAKVPACCRRGGKHHCAGSGEGSTSGPAVQASRCPAFPGAQSTPPQAAAGISVGRTADFVLVAAEPAPILPQFRLSERSHRTEPPRGPPAA